MTLVRKLAMLAVAAYFVVCVTAAAVDVDEVRILSPLCMSNFFHHPS